MKSMTVSAAAMAAGSLACDGCPNCSARAQEVLGARVSRSRSSTAPAASAYTEAALINAPASSARAPSSRRASCSRRATAWWAPRQWTVSTPLRGQPERDGPRAHGPTTCRRGEYVNPNTLDVAVIILDTPITLSPTRRSRARHRVPARKAVNVGRIRNGQASYSGLFFGSAVTLSSRLLAGLPHGLRLRRRSSSRATRAVPSTSAAARADAQLP